MWLFIVLRDREARALCEAVCFLFGITLRILQLSGSVVTLPALCGAEASREHSIWAITVVDFVGFVAG